MHTECGQIPPPSNIVYIHVHTSIHMHSGPIYDMHACMKRECVGFAVCVHVSIQPHRTPKTTPYVGNQAKRDAMLVVTRSHNKLAHIMATSHTITMFYHSLDHRILRSYKGKLEKDLRGKFGAQDIDSTCAGLTDDRQDLTYNAVAVKIQTK